MKKGVKVIIFILLVMLGVSAYYLLRRPGASGRDFKVVQWLRNPSSHPEWAVEAKTTCGEAPFLMPTSGFIGYLWDDSFRPGHHHQGIDIFAGTAPGTTPVYAAYPGYLTRLPEWKSSVIIRIPADPLLPARQVWTYYTHMADRNGDSYISTAFPPGTSEVYVEAGTLLGYQGNYSGDPGNPVGVHLHFSIVQDDGEGRFRNELQIGNTYDPSPYLGLDLNARQNPDGVPLCSQ